MVLLIGAGLRLAALSRPLAALDGLTLPDDAYLAAEIAKNLGQGEGPRYGDEATNGYQPLHVLLSSLFFLRASNEQVRDPAFLDAAVKKSLGITVAADLLAILLLAFVLARRLGWGAATLAAAALWAAQPAFLRTCLNGLETSLAVLALLAIWWWLETRCGAGARRRDWFLLGVLCGLGMLARLDLVLAAGWTVVIAAWRLWRRSRHANAVMIPLALIAAGALLAYGPWLAWSWRETGMLLPVSGKAVRFMALANVGHSPDAAYFLESLHRALAAILRGNESLWLLAAAVLLAALVATRSRVATAADWRQDRDWLALPLLFAVSLVTAYAFFVPAWWFFDRYLQPVQLVAVLLVASGLHRLLRGSRRASAPTAAATAVGFAVALSLAQPASRTLLTCTYDPDLGYRHIGLWAARTFPAGTVVGSSQTGALAYYAPDLEVVNLDGVVNAAAFRSLVERRHLAYLQDRRVQYVIGWDINLRFIWDHSAPGAKSLLVFRGNIVDESRIPLRSWDNDWLVYEVRLP